MKGNRAIILCTSSYEEGTGGAMGVTRKRRASESGSNMLPMLALDLLRCSRGRAEGREVLTLTPAEKLLFFSLLPNF